MKFIKIDDYEITQLNTDKPFIISGGVGENMNFEDTLLNLHPNTTIFCYDFTDKALNFFNNKNFSDNIFLFRNAISSNKNFTSFKLPDYANVCSESEFMQHENNVYSNGFRNVRSLDLDDLCSINKQINILKLDIEGSEYELLLNLNKNHYEKIDQITGEFHQYRIKSILRDTHNKLIDHLVGTIGYKYKITDESHGIYLFYKDI